MKRPRFSTRVRGVLRVLSAYLDHYKSGRAAAAAVVFAGRDGKE